MFYNIKWTIDKFEWINLIRLYVKKNLLQVKSINKPLKLQKKLKKLINNNSVYNVQMYLIRIEQVYSQCVRHFELVTNNIMFIDKFRNELVRYKNHLLDLDSDDLDNWEFYEYVYYLINYNSNINVFNGYCLYEKIYSDNFCRLDRFDENILRNPIKSTNVLESFEYNDPILLHHVYNYIDITIIPIYIDNFDIIGKNYLK